MKPVTLMITQLFHFQKHIFLSWETDKPALSPQKHSFDLCHCSVEAASRLPLLWGKVFGAPPPRLQIAWLAHPAAAPPGYDGVECVPSCDRLQKRNSFVLQTCSGAVLKSFVYLFMQLLIPRQLLSPNMIITSCNGRRDHVPLFFACSCLDAPIAPFFL